MAHKHKWQFVDFIIDGTMIDTKPEQYIYRFVCECGAVKIVRGKNK